MAESATAASASGASSSSQIEQTPRIPSTPSGKLNPSFARSTASSTMRASLTPKISSPTTRRSSTLSGTDRQLALLLQHTSSLNIKPRDPSLPCLFAAIPSEIRCMIYAYFLPGRSIILPTTDRMHFGSPWGKGDQTKTLWPLLLRVCRAIRLEYAYQFYTRTPFLAYSNDLDFSDFMSWVRKLPAQHRVLLTRNRGIQISLQLRNGNDGRFALDADYGHMLLAKRMNEAWKECRKYGNLYTVSGDQHKQHFVDFCKLSDWFLWSAKPLYTDFKFKYSASYADTQWAMSKGKALLAFLKQGLGVVQLPCTQHASLKEGQKDIIKKRALEMLGELEKVFRALTPRQRGGVDEEWDRRVVSLRKFLE
ncbi:hypothetical protein BDV96DRAFT_216978 [Lophiotrema nucula]|uniref:2EXR domain-containing protein n=1 Tax=Lophiotrema nucula TaxID=690887 RepID=A0A6A5ZQZ2_9PLEO|nr:hypothetical protein BDV96DRAFT_216978 [Lophiotrema nucula]